MCRYRTSPFRSTRTSVGQGLTPNSFHITKSLACTTGESTPSRFVASAPLHGKQLLLHHIVSSFIVSHRSLVRRGRSDDLVSAGSGLAEASHRVRRQSAVDLIEPKVDLAVGEGEEAPSLAVALHEEGAEPLDLQHPEGLGDPELREPVDVDDALDAAPVRGAHPVSHGGEVDGDVRHEPLAVGELGEHRFAVDVLRPRELGTPPY